MRDIDKIPSRIRYYLLDYKDKNIEDFQSYFGSKRLHELNTEELKRCFALASAKDLGKFLI